MLKHNADISPPAELNELARKVREQHVLVGTSASKTLTHAFAAGEALLAAKDLIDHGGWARWRWDNCGLSERSARRYMQLAKARAEIENRPRVAGNLTLNAALRLIAKPRASKPKQAASRSELANTITKALRLGLSQVRCEQAIAASNALIAINAKLESAGLDLHDVEVTIRPKSREKAAA
jgi:hypothetical protein